MHGTRVMSFTLLGIVIATALLAAPRVVIDVRWRLRMTTSGESNPYEV